MLWLYAQPGFLDINLFGANLRDLFQVREVALSTAVWVGFIALFGIATDDGVVITTYLKQSIEKNSPSDKEGIRKAVVEAGARRVRPCLMTTATTLLALLPVLTSTGRGSDIMLPMAIPVFGGMTIELLTMFVVPTLYCWQKELRLKRQK
ncbi:multidrug resistance protein MdtC [Rubritalea halochordaticola]|uniref:Multidrug resistance protein MdtC n=1 Tax=Rubritalea halochordaticola TaxID=714537 RepID=A0ABP9V2C6_9BACT